MTVPFEPGPRRWDPTTEIFPGGPHPGAVAQMQAEAASRQQRAIDGARRRRRRRARNHLLLLR